MSVDTAKSTLNFSESEKIKPFFCSLFLYKRLIQSNVNAKIIFYYISISYIRRYLIGIISSIMLQIGGISACEMCLIIIRRDSVRSVVVPQTVKHISGGDTVYHLTIE